MNRELTLIYANNYKLIEQKKTKETKAYEFAPTSARVVANS